MRSKTSKRPPQVLSPLKSELNCAESDYSRIASLLIARANGRPGVLLLEGEMGAGKSTFARAFLAQLGVKDSFQGSPTFAITHTYASQSREYPVITHSDLYRIKHEQELEHTGIEEWVWSRDTQWALIEWSSLFEGFTSQIHKRLSREKWICEVRLRISKSGSQRDFEFREF